MNVLVTGAAGFVGFHLTRRLLEAGHTVTGIDNLNSYYTVNLKNARLSELGIDVSKIDGGQPVKSAVYQQFEFIKLNIEDRERLPQVFERGRFDAVVNLAAQAGMRFSIDEPFSFIDSNIVGFTNVLECCRHNQVKHLVYASSSSVYGSNTKVPFAETDRTDNPVNLYAATKRANELMASCYSALYNIPSTGLRFFTVYGPWGRADMAPMLFAKAIANGEPISVFNGGDVFRDFTYIDDIVDSLMLVIAKQPEPQPDGRRHQVYNVGCSSPVRLSDFIALLEDALGRKAEKQMLPMQPGDLYQTFADSSAFERNFGYRPQTPIAEGIKRFAEWFISEGFALIYS
ncbi:MAG: NAD-dependent epimerase/dehydratase family protein [Bacteroidales bacterium]|nr:NAD-dependent epimerase/dehydratase family protein [Bacteroidales bacterium]MBR6081676.1 NAD-dependent epimerase/dehydratase family protein [Salinivirgaceae bacterium]